MLETLRKQAFWSLDFLRGRKVWNHYHDIAHVFTAASFGKAAVRCEKSLTAILQHAITTTEFYKNRSGLKSLYDFPVINKSIIRASFKSFISSKFKESDLIPVVTSGSTGTPFKVYHDRNKKLRNSADAIFFAQLAGYSLGNRIIYMKIWVKDKMKSSFRFWMENTIPIDVIKFDDIQIAGLLHKMEHDKSTFMIVGYSSALELVCKYIERTHKGSVEANVKSVIAISETLNDYTKETFHKYFGVLAVSRYSNLENGIIAQQEITGSGKYIINTASYVVEILKMNSDDQAEPGQMGRIVVTDLFNYGMPIIRYDTGDVGAISVDSSKAENMYFAKIEGRKIDMLYDTNGNLVSSYMVYKNMWQYTDIIQYQLIQKGQKEYTIKINVDGSFSKEAKLIKEFKFYLGEDAIISIEYVSEIPLLSSGKRKMIVNKFLQKHDEEYKIA